MPTNPAPSPLPEGQARAIAESVMERTQYPLNDGWWLVWEREALIALVQAGAAAVSPEVRERERREAKLEGAREALMNCAEAVNDLGTVGGSPKNPDIAAGHALAHFILDFCDREYPAALTPPSVTPTCETCGGELAAEAIARGEHRHPNESLCLRSLASQVAALAAQVRGAK